MPFVEELQAKMAAAAGVIHITEDDELRLETKCRSAAVAERYNLFRWTATDGLVPVSGDILTGLREQGLDVPQQLGQWSTILDPVALLRQVKTWTLGPSVVLTFDLVTLLNRLPTKPLGCRLIKDITAAQQEYDSTGRDDPFAGICQLILCDRETPELETPLQRLTLELPDRRELAGILDVLLDAVDDKIAKDATKHREAILNSLMGLPAYQAANAIAEAISRTGRADADVIRSFKKDLVSAKGITWIDPDPRGFDSLGGLEPAKQWAMKRAIAFDEELRAKYGTRPPKGLLAGGIPGCAKSAFARAIASAWGGGMVLLRLDVGATRGKFQGESENQLQAAILTASAIAPAILWIDEIDKQFGDSNSEVDGGTSARVLGFLLTWMQEKTEQVFVYGAGNRMDKLPSEFMRAGRFDRALWFDLPVSKERAAIINVFVQKYPMIEKDLDIEQLVQASDRCSGAEIEASFEEAALTAMAEERKITTADIVQELQTVTKVTDTFEITPELAKWRDAALKANAEEISIKPTTQQRGPRRMGRVKLNGTTP